MIASRQELTSESVALHYDELDHFYREVWGEHVHHGLWSRGNESSLEAVEQLVEMVAARAHIKAGAQVCDVGCGYGATARQLAREFGAEVTALTISEAQYNYAAAWSDNHRNHSQSPAEPHGSRAAQPIYLFCNWLKNGLPSQSFDAVLSIESSEHMTDKPAFFAEAHRVLRPGGRFVICAWLSKEKPFALEKHFLLEPICRESRMPSMGTEQDYRQFFASAGFIVDGFEDITRQVKKTWPICVWRFLKKLCVNPRYVKFLLNKHKHNRIFALTMLRIWLAYNTGTMRYGVFTAHKPQV